MAVFSDKEKLYLKIAIQQCRASTIRACNKEANPDIVRLKNEDVKNLDTLLAKIGGL